LRIGPKSWACHTHTRTKSATVTQRASQTPTSTRISSRIFLGHDNLGITNRYFHARYHTFARGCFSAMEYLKDNG
jgi:hypothetical protein